MYIVHTCIVERVVVVVGGGVSPLLLNISFTNIYIIVEK